MSRITSIFFFSFIHLTSYAQNANFVWVKQMGGAGGGAGGSSIAVDALGNVYTTGEFVGVIDFDPGPAIFNLSSAFNSNDIFVSKLDAAGNLVWAKQIGGDSYDASFSIAIDATGNVYTTGYFEGIADFDPGPGIFNLIAAAGADIFISKLDATGNFVWAKQLGGGNPFGTDLSLSIAIDAAGNIYTTGGFGGTVDFDPGPSVFTLTTALNCSDIFISKLDAGGNFVWAKQLSGAAGVTWGGNLGLSIAIDVTGNIYTTGQFFSIVDFDPGPGVFNLSTGSVNTGDIFVSKLNPAGNFIWAKQMHGVGYTQSGIGGLSIVLDAIGDVYTTGFFQGTVDFDGGPGVFNLSSSGSYDIFIFKLDAAGNFIWAKQIGGVGDDQAASIARDNTGNIYTTGYFNNTVDFDPGPGAFSLSSAGIDEIFILKLDGAGNFVWAKKMGGTGRDGSGSIVLDASKNIYTTGGFQNTVDFDPGIGVFDLTAMGLYDVFAHKMSQCANSTSSTINASACSTYTLNGQTYTASGVYIQSIINAAGCDSIITLNLTIRPTLFSVINASICEGQDYEGYSIGGMYTDTLLAANGCDSVRTINLTVFLPSYSVINAAICAGQTYSGYSTPGLYIDTLVAANGCDSVRTINLTVNPESFSTLIKSICQGQTYSGHGTSGTYIDTLAGANGCDSIQTLHLTVNPAYFIVFDTTICHGQAVDGYQSSGTYTTIFRTVNGCDSVRTINLTVLPELHPSLGIDNSICAGDSLILYPGQFDRYVWQNGSTQSRFIVKQPGVYSVVVTNQCGSASDDILVKEGICDIYFPSAFTPNNDGKNDWFKMLGANNVSDFHLVVYNRWGQKVFETTDITKGWSGEVKGQLQNSGIFIWYCAFKKNGNSNIEKRKGTVMLIK